MLVGDGGVPAFGCLVVVSAHSGTHRLHVDPSDFAQHLLYARMGVEELVVGAGCEVALDAPPSVGWKAPTPTTACRPQQHHVPVSDGVALLIDAPATLVAHLQLSQLGGQVEPVGMRLKYPNRNVFVTHNRTTAESRRGRVSHWSRIVGADGGDCKEAHIPVQTSFPFFRLMTCRHQAPSVHFGHR